MLKQYVEFLYKYKWYFTLLIPILITLFSLNLSKAEIDGSYRIWFSENSKELKTYDRFRDEFSNDDAITIVFKDSNTIFNPKAIKSIERIQNLLLSLSYVEKVSTLVNYQYVHQDNLNSDDILVNDFIENIDNLTKEYLLERKNIALHDENILNGYISKEGKTTMIVARLDTNDKEDISAKIMEDVNNIISKETNITGYKYWINGGPAMVQAFVKTAQDDSSTFTPIVFSLSILLLLLLFRKISGALLPLLVVLFTTMLVLTIQVTLGYKLNTFTINIPVFIVAIGIADAIHIYGIWLRKIKEGISTKEAVLFSLEKNILPTFFTSLTTVIGFGSLAFSSIVPVSTLGIATSSGVILAFMLSLIWLPSVLMLINNNKKNINNKKKNTFKWNYGKFILKYNKVIIISFIFLVSISFLGLFKLQIDTNMIKYFDKDHDIRKSSEFTMNNLTGSVSYEIVIDAGRENGVYSPEFLNKVEEFYQQYQNKFPKDVRYMTSIKDIIKRYNKIITEKDEIPKDQDLVSQYVLLYSMSLDKAQNITDLMDFMQQKLRLTVVVNLVNTSKDLEMIGYAQEWWSQTPYKVTITGKTVMNAFLQNKVANTLIFSLSITLLLVSLIMYLIFGRIKMLWLFILPNILPVIIVLGIMGWIGIYIDIGVAITGAIVIGIAVDDSIHFFFKYFSAKENNDNIEDVLNEVIIYAGKAILFTTLVLSISFGLIIFSDFLPNRNFAIITSSGLMIAMLLDIFLLPALLSLFIKTNKTHTITK